MLGDILPAVLLWYRRRQQRRMLLTAAVLMLLPPERPLVPGMRLDIGSLNNATCTLMFR